jgi:transposase InsO family protein
LTAKLYKLKAFFILLILFEEFAQSAKWTLPQQGDRNISMEYKQEGETDEKKGRRAAQAPEGVQGRIGGAGSVRRQWMERNGCRTSLVRRSRADDSAWRPCRAFSAGLETVRTAVPALRIAFKNRAAQDGLLFHSGQWVQYCAKLFCALSQEYCPAVRQSVSRKGNCQDNARGGSFFKTPKRERETPDGKHAVAARQSIFMYPEAYYNRLRLHSALGYAAPAMLNSGRVA